MAISLQPSDVARLLSDPSADLRTEFAVEIAAKLEGNSLNPGEIAIAQDIVRILARDIEAKVRASLSYGLRHSRHLPQDVARKMADDIEAVALPVLAESLALTDADLASIVVRGSPLKQEMIAGRPDLSEAVSDQLLTHAPAPVVVQLMGNSTARIAEDSLDRAVTRFAENDWVKQSMVLRHRLPMNVAERLVTMVSNEFQEHLVKMHALSPKLATDIVLRCREKEILHLSTGSADAELRGMVAQMHHNGRLTPTLMLRALCTGDIAFFEAAMAVKGNVPVANAQILIHEPSRRGLAALYHKATMPDSLFNAVRAAIDVVDDTGFDGNERDLERFRSRVISRVLTMSENMDAADADYLIDRLGDVLEHPRLPEDEAGLAVTTCPVRSSPLRIGRTCRTT